MNLQERQSRALAELVRAAIRFEDEMREPVRKARVGFAEAGRQLSDLISRQYQKR